MIRVNLAPKAKKNIRAVNKQMAKARRARRRIRRNRWGNCHDEILQSRMGKDNYEYWFAVNRRVKRITLAWELSWPAIFLSGIMAWDYAFDLSFWILLSIMWLVMGARTNIKNWHLKRVRKMADAELRLLGIGVGLK